MAAILKLVNLNIEREKHLSRIVPFLNHERADIICLQEVFLDDVLKLERELGMHGYYAPMTLYGRSDSTNIELEPEGVAILTKEPLQNVQKNYYANCGRTAGHLQQFQHGNQDTIQRVLLSGTIQQGLNHWKIATTHFTWTPDGHADDVQRRDVDTLLEVLHHFSDIVFCGDFNAPRGREVFGRLSDAFIDWVPKDVSTTIDQNLHKVKNLQHVVDAIFSTEHYSLSNVRVVDGLSDHCAIVGLIQSASHVLREIDTETRVLVL